MNKNFVISASFVFCALATCCAAGVSDRANAAKSAGARVARALEQYKRDKHNYPNALSELVPAYLGTAPLPVNGKTDGVRFIYVSPSGQDYKLIYQYFRPGTNRCLRRSSDPEGQWSCSGAY